MKTKDRELTIFTPGLSSQSLNMDYFEIDHMIIAGTMGSGRQTLVTSIVKSMMESNDVGKVSYIVIDPEGYENNPLANAKRITPYNELQRWLQSQDYHSIWGVLKLVMESARSWTAGFDFDRIDSSHSELKKSKLVIVVPNYDKLPEFFRLMLLDIVSHGTGNSGNIKCIISGEDVQCLKHIADKCRYRMVTRVESDEDSNIILGCNLAHRCSDKFGSVWFRDMDNTDVFTKHVVSFTPDSLLNRMMKTYASGKQSGNTQVAKLCYLSSNSPGDWTSQLVTKILAIHVGEDCAKKAYEEMATLMKQEES